MMKISVWLRQYETQAVQIQVVKKKENSRLVRWIRLVITELDRRGLGRSVQHR
jgi:hypothetical protein